MTTDQQQDRYDHLLALPHLWPEQIAELQRLSAELGRAARFYRLDLNNQAAGGQETPRP